MGSQRLRIVVGGFLGILPYGGVAWDYLQYPLGFVEMGHEVHYIEDTRLWPVYQAAGNSSHDCTGCVDYLARLMGDFDLADRWAYRDEPSGLTYGLSAGQVQNICETADVFVNISCSTFMRDEYLRIPIRILIDSDPMFTQIQLETQSMFTPGTSRLQQLIEAHTHHFTFGENIGSADCRVPTCGVRWIPTRQPICLSHWTNSPRVAASQLGYTTVMNWSAARSLEYQGESWGQKDAEWHRLETLPAKLPEIPFSVAIGKTSNVPIPEERVRRNGWRVLDPQLLVPDWRSYRSFIQQSRGEISIAKHTYVKSRCGWFSCRSACYLASGRPVVTQDTGWTRFLPHGCGLFAFEDVEGAVAALREIEADPARHSGAAREIAEQHFSASQILGRMLSQAGA